MGVAGLAIASDVGILLHTIALAWLLNRSELVRLRDLEWMEMMKALATAVLAAAACYAAARTVVVDGSRRSDLLALLIISAAWVAAVAAGLWLTRSKLPGELRRRKAARAAEMSSPTPSSVELTTGGVEP